MSNGTAIRRGSTLLAAIAVVSVLLALPALGACSKATYHDAAEAVASGPMAADLAAHHADIEANNQWNSVHHYNGDREIAESYGWVWDETTCSFSMPPSPTTTLASTTTLAPTTTSAPPTTPPAPSPSTTSPDPTTTLAPTTTIPSSANSTNPTSSPTTAVGSAVGSTSSESTSTTGTGVGRSSSAPTAAATDAEVAGVEIEAADVETAGDGSLSLWPIWLGLALVVASTAAWPIARRRQG